MSKRKPGRTILEAPPIAADGKTASSRHLPILLLLFVGSGCAALIYEIVWFQLLQLGIGSSAVSLGVLLGTYMGGMCLGSALLPRFVKRSEHPLRIYALIELGIGICGILVLYGVPLLDRLYAAVVGVGLPAILLRGVICALCLLPPTLLMGASLPAMSRWIETTPRGVSWLGFFYGGNIAGAVFGCLWAGFHLLRVYDMRTATFVAAAINFGVAFIAWTLAGRSAYEPSAGQSENRVPRPAGAWPVYASLALSGMCALGAEVIWTRLLSLMLGATVYTFSIILAVFLFGLGIGSSAGSFLSRYTARPRLALGCVQMSLVAAIAWTAYNISEAIPYWPVNPLLSTNPWFTFQIDLVRTLWAILPAALLWGASFPLALAALASRDQDPGQLVGEAYAANTVGAILGAVGFALIFIPTVGTQNSQRLLIAFATLSAFIVFFSLRQPTLERAEAPLGMKGWAVASVALLVSVLLIAQVSEVPWLAIAYGRRIATKSNSGRPLYLGEGMNSSVLISELPDGKIYFHVSGKVEASTEAYDMRLQRMLGHLPALVHPKPKSVLIVGFGAGVTAGTFVTHPDIERIVICEIEPLIPPASTRYFARENYNVLNDRRVQVVYDDARHYILTTKEKFDIITSDPIHPWVKGTATLYSTEYFNLVREHLNPDGVVTQWVPLYESDSPTVKSEIATFFKVFPKGTIWGNTNEGGYDSVLLGRDGDSKISIDELQQRLDRPDHARVARSLATVGFTSAVDLLSTYAGRASDLAPWLEGAEINRDLNLRLQYLAGMGVNNDRAVAIYEEILSFSRFPDDLIVGPPPLVQMLRAELGGR
jgi:spermidine synthase